MEIKGKKCLVTGAGGFIGSHLVESLLVQGGDVRAMVRYNGRNDPGMLRDLPEEARGAIEIRSGDIRDPFFVRRAVAGCDVVFHLAALIGIPYSYVAPQDYVSVNVEGTLNVLQACRDERTPRLVHTSTSETYGTARYVPINEEHPLQGQSPYSASKVGADKMAESYFCSFGLPVVTVRPFNTYGPRQSARAIIPTVIAQALTRDRIVLGSLDPVRDLTFVRDTVDGFVKVGMEDDGVGRVLNLGVGSGVAIGDVARLILKLMGREDLPIELDTSRVRPPKSEVMKLVSDNRLAREVAGWSPGCSLEQGLAETIAWFRNQPGFIDNPGHYAV